MKKILLSLLALIMGTVAYAQTELNVTFPMTDQESVSAYSCEWTGKDADGNTWTFKNFNNYNNGWTYIKCGWKNAATTSEITSPEIAEAVTEFAITVDKTSNVTSCKFEVVKGGSVVETKDVTLEAGKVTVALAGTKGATYHLVIENEQVSSNGTTQISALTVVKSASEDTAAKPGLTDGGVFTTKPFDVIISNKENGATVYYTIDGVEPTTSSESFTGDSKTIQISETTTVKAMAVVSGKSNSSIASATYTYEESIENTLETAYTTAQAIALIDAGSAQLKTTKVFVKGSVSKVQSFSSSYGSISYWLDEDAFEVYGGLNNNGEQFTSIDDVKVGAEVVVYGIVKKYNTTYEMDKNNWLVKYSAPSKPEPTLTLTPYSSSLEEGDYEEVSATYTGDGTLTVTSSDPEVASVELVDVDATITALKAGTTTITFALSETDSYQAKEVSYTLTVTGKAVPAEVPFEFDGGVADIDPSKGMIQSGIDSKDYVASPKLKFNTTADYLIINIASEAKYLNYTIKGNGNDAAPGATGQYDVLESADGKNYTTVKSYTELNTGEDKDAISETNIELKSDTRFIKFIYTNKVSGNVGLGAIKIKNDKEVLRGDANDDGKITMADAMYVINYILDTPAEDFNFDGADANLDGQITMADTMLIVNSILNESFPEN